MSTKQPLTDETKVNLLLAMSQCVNNPLDLDDVLNSLLDTVLMIFDYDAAGIFILNDELVKLSFSRPRQLIAAVIMRGFSAFPAEFDPMLTEGKGIIGHVISTGESIVLPDVRNSQTYVEGRISTLSEITVPITLNNRIIGALNLESDRLNTYDEDDIDTLCFFADAATISIEKALLHNQLLEAQRIETQLETAREVQARLIPDKPPRITGYDIFGLCLPTYAIGGDYFDFFPLGENRLGVVIADVSGDGIPAALVMSAFRALLRTQAQQAARRENTRRGRQTGKIKYSTVKLNPSRFISRINQLLPEFTGTVTFVTAIFGILDTKNNEFAFSVGGHHPPILFRPKADPFIFKKGGTALGIVPKARFRKQVINLKDDDFLLLYTDGVVEIENDRGEPFGTDRLITVIQEENGGSSSYLLTKIVQVVQQFTASNTFPDDFTLLAIRKTHSVYQDTKRPKRPGAIELVA